ncbi:MAG: NAD(+)/NADH kinase [Anaerorhabdus sp.]
MKSFAVISRPDEHSKMLSDIIEKKLVSIGYRNEEQAVDLCVVVGGDGTFLRAVQQHKAWLTKTAFIGIHTGTLGFFSGYYEEEIDQFFEDIQEKEMIIKEADLLEVTRLGSSEKLMALNEIRVENSTKTQVLDITVNEEFFEQYHGTGICIATQLGSTAYNRSIQGAVVAEGLSVMQISEIAGIHHNKYHSLGSSLIVPADAVIQLHSSDFEGAVLCADSQCVSLQKEETITCRKSSIKVRIAQYKTVSYLSKVKGLFS